jgi:hypothetical protein
MADDLSPKQLHAIELIDQLIARGGHVDPRIGCQKDGIWLNVCRNKVAEGLKARVKDPSLINQHKTNLCGIAGFVYDWAEDDPAGYAWLGISLYEAGWGRVGRGEKLGKEVRPSRDLRSSPVPYHDIGNHRGLEMNHADWIILASLREAFNSFFTRYTADEFPLEALTTPGEVVNAFKAAGYTNIVDKTSWASSEDFDNVLEASQKLNAGWRVLLLINMRMLKDKTIDTQAVIAPTADHWVRLQTKIELKLEGKDYIIPPFSVYTWGAVHQIPKGMPYVLWPAFKKNYYGFVAAKY